VIDGDAAFGDDPEEIWRAAARPYGVSARL
jgi:hypothetical protein